MSNGNADLNYPFSTAAGNSVRNNPADCEKIGTHWFTGPVGKRKCHRCDLPEPKDTK